DLLGADVAFAAAFELAHDAVDHPLNPVGIDGALAQRHLHRAHELVAIEWYPPAAPLGDHQLTQLDALEGGETATAVGADPPPANGRVVLRRTRILHLSVDVAAVGAAHRAVFFRPGRASRLRPSGFGGQA